jgi:hypothetical protein
VSTVVVGAFLCLAVLPHAALGGVAVAHEALTIRLGATGVTSIALSRAALLKPEGYVVGYAIEPPQQQEFLLWCWACAAAEFVEVRVILIGTEAVEIRSRRPLDPAALIIRPGLAGPTAVWDVDIGRAPVPKAPTAEEVQQRQAAVSVLLSRTQDALGGKGYTGGPVAMQVRPGAHLALRGFDAPVQYTYVLSALGTPDLTESLAMLRPPQRWDLNVQATFLEVYRATEGADANVIVDLQVGEDGWWQGDVTTITFPGGHMESRKMTREEAAQLLQEALQELRQARHRFGLAFAPDVTKFRVP